MAVKKKAIVIGGGVIGLCSAYYAARRGFDVTVVDASDGGPEGCSHGNAGLIVPSHFVPLASPGAIGAGLRWLFDSESPFYIKPRFDLELAGWLWRFLNSSTNAHVRDSSPVLRDLNLASRTCYEELAAESDDFGLSKDGVLLVCRTQNALNEEGEVAHRARELGLQVEILDAAETRRKEPTLASDIAGAAYYPQDCRLDPGRFIHGLRRRLADLGAQLLFERPVTGWRMSDNCLYAVDTPDGPIEGDTFVVAGGAWSGRMARQLKTTLPLQPGRGYSLTLRRPSVMPRSAALCVEARLAITPMGDRLRFAGTMELVGLATSVNPSRLRGMMKSIPRYYPDFGPDHFADIEPWAGLRPCSPDGLPYIGRLRSASNVIVATGHAMMGLSLGPITGKLVSEVMDDMQPSLPLDPIRPERFS